MEILKRLKKATAVEPEAVLIKDGDVEYPVFFASLTNTVLFPELIKSGYKLIALPYLFEKDGVTTDELPVETYATTAEVEEAEYDSLGTPMLIEDLRKQMSATETHILPTPEHNYRIETREEFLKYLDHCLDIDDPTDIEPINYFVSPVALFDFDEFLAEENTHYRAVMEQRRNLTYERFQYLYTFLQQFGINEDSSFNDIIDAYMAWGVDGLRWTVATKRTNMFDYPVFAVVVGSDTLKNYTYCTGLMDCNGSKIVADKYKDKVWEPTLESRALINYWCMPDEFGKVRLQPGNTIVVDYRRPTKAKHTELNCGTYLIRYDTKTVLIGDTYNTNTLQVKSFRPGEFMSNDLVLVSKVQAFYEDSYEYALAQKLHDKCIVPSDATSYDTLISIGLNPYDALRYIAMKLQLTPAFEPDEGVPVILDDTIQSFVNGTLSVESQEYEILSDIVSGVTNCDQIADGIMEEARASAANIYKRVKIIHEVLGVSLEEIYDKINNATVGGEKIVFEGRNVSLGLSTAKLNYRYLGAQNDKITYLSEAAANADYISKVLTVARELGSNEATRHVAAEFLAIKRTPIIEMVYGEIKTRFIEKVEAFVTDPNMKAMSIRYADIFAARALFEIYEHNRIVFTNLGTTPIVEDATEDEINAVKGAMNTYCDTIAAWTAVTIKPSESTQARSLVVQTLPNGMRLPITTVTSAYKISRYCVNAMITPTQIIPAKGVTLPEKSIKVLWKDYSMTTMYQKIIASGVIDSSFKAWESRSNVSFVKRKLFYEYLDNTSIQYYMKNAESDIEESKNDKLNDYVAVTHPVEYLYPGIYQKAEPKPYEGNILENKGIVVHIAYMREITADMFKAESNTYVSHCKLFEGFDADTFYMGINVFMKLPTSDGVTKSLLYSTDKFVAVDTQQIYDFSRLPELMQAGYPITQVRNNIYLVKLISGDLMEVEL